MNRLFTMIAALLLSMALTAQTLNVEVGSVVYQVPAGQAGEMAFQDGQALTILDKEFVLSDISQMYIDNTAVTDDAVQVVYNGATARVFVAGNVARYVSVSVSGAHVGITQSSDLDREITYTLSGSTTDGEFFMDGSYKATVELDGVAIVNANPVYSGAAVYIKNGKRIDISVKKDTENALTDCATPSADMAHKACLWVKGHAELKGKGTLNVNCRYGDAHAIKTGEYMSLKNCTVNVLSAGKDGLHVNEYFLMQSGTLSVSGVGDDAVQAELDGTTNTGQTADHEDEDSGNIYIDGGTLTLTTTAAGSKGLKSDSTVVVADGNITIHAGGGVDTSDASDPSYVAGISAGKFVQNGGTLAIDVSGSAGRGIKAYDVETNGGELTIANSAAIATVNSDAKGAKGIKGLNIALNAGTISITMSAAGGKGIRVGDGTQSSTGGGGGGGWWFGPGGGGPGGGGGGMGGGSKWTDVTGSFTMGTSDGNGPTLTVNTSNKYNSNSSNKAIKAICAVTIFGGTTEILTQANGAEGLESKTSIDIRGGQHYLKCYDDCINSAGKILFSGGVTVCYSTGNDAVDSNAGTTGAVTIGDGAMMAYTTKGAPEEGIDCDNNSYIQITGKGIAISAGASQGGGSNSTISNAVQGYAFLTSGISYSAGRYYTLSDSSGNNLVTYSFPASLNSSLSLFTATGMVKGGSYNVKYSTTAPTDAVTSWHGLYLGSTHVGTTAVTSFTAK